MIDVLYKRLVLGEPQKTFVRPSPSSQPSAGPGTKGGFAEEGK